MGECTHGIHSAPCHECSLVGDVQTIAYEFERGGTNELRIGSS